MPLSEPDTAYCINVRRSPVLAVCLPPAAVSFRYQRPKRATLSKSRSSDDAGVSQKLPRAREIPPRCCRGDTLEKRERPVFLPKPTASHTPVSTVRYHLESRQLRMPPDDTLFPPREYPALLLKISMNCAAGESFARIWRYLSQKRNTRMLLLCTGNENVLWSNKRGRGVLVLARYY